MLMKLQSLPLYQMGRLILHRRSEQLGAASPAWSAFSS